MRVHANFAEYVPLALLLIFLVESSHAFGVSGDPENFRFRIFGMALTFSALLVCAIYLLVNAVAE